jgi:sialate O-acetylesterase
MAAFVLYLALTLTLGAHAYVTVPGIFSDGMVLQEHSTYDQRPMIYGQATQPGELVTVIRHLPNGHNDTYYATSDASSFWIVQLDPDYFSASQNNLTIYITGSVPPLNTITIRDVVYGDVFLCGGQSNMNENVAACFDNVTTMSQTFPKFRLFSMAEAGATTPQTDIPAFNSTHTTPCSFPQFPVPNTQQVCNTWQSATEPTVIGSFSATCFYTALALSRTINDGRYFGLIHASVSGTAMKLWAPQPAISKCDSLVVDPSSSHPQHTPPPPLPLTSPPPSPTPTPPCGMP